MFTIKVNCLTFAFLCTHGYYRFKLLWCIKKACSAVYAHAIQCKTDYSFLCQVPAVDAQSCAAELHHALAKNDYQQASSLIRLAPHPGVFEMVNKQQQNALHLAGKQHQHQQLPFNLCITLPGAPCPDASYACLCCSSGCWCTGVQCSSSTYLILAWTLLLQLQRFSYVQAEMYSKYLVHTFV